VTFHTLCTRRDLDWAHTSRLREDQKSEVEPGSVGMKAGIGDLSHDSDATARVMREDAAADDHFMLPSCLSDAMGSGEDDAGGDNRASAVLAVPSAGSGLHNGYGPGDTANGHWLTVPDGLGGGWCDETGG
jgi:hypothetical protein